MPAVDARSRVSSSSTPPTWPTQVLEPRTPCSPGRRAGRRRRHHQPAGDHDRVGPGDGRADRPRRSAGRTCARSASASTAKAEHGWRSRRTSRSRRSPGCSPTADGLAGRDLCFGTVDSWIAWTLSGGARCTSPIRRTRARHRPAARRRHRTGTTTCSTLLAHAPIAMLPDVVDSVGVVGEATALPGAPPIAGIARRPAGVARRPGLRRARPGQDHVRHRRHARPVHRRRTRPASAGAPQHGTFPIVAVVASTASCTWGVEAIMLSAGTNVEWLRDDLGLIATSAAEPRRRRRGATTPTASCTCPALLGLGTPHWDYGARGTLLGITRGTEPAARRARRARGHRPSRRRPASRRPRPTPASTSRRVRIDGGMSANPTFVQALADAAGRPIEVSPVAEVDDDRRGVLAGLATGVWTDLDARRPTGGRRWSSSRQGSSTGPNGRKLCREPRHGFLNYRPWTSRMAKMLSLVKGRTS